MQKVYLDNAATTPIAPEVLEAMTLSMQEHVGNPSSIHAYGRKVRAELELCRKNIAQKFNCLPSEIIFTSGGTEADNMAIKCAMIDLGIKHAITSEIEHSAVKNTFERLRVLHDFELHYVKLLPNGDIDLEDLEKLLKKYPEAFVSLMHANNEIGNMLDIHKVATLCKEHNAIFHSDTVQSIGHYKFDLKSTPIDFLTCSAHKFHGPKGVGFIFIRQDIEVKPLIQGGSQERSLRAGTENIHGIVALNTALNLAYDNFEENESTIQGLKDYMIQELEEKIPGVEYNGNPKGLSLSTVLNVLLPQIKNTSMFLFNLDLAGIACSGGSACNSGANIGSHVLTAIESDMNRSSIRFSFSRYTTKKEIDKAITVLEKLVRG